MAARDVLWTGLESPGHEHLRLTTGPDRFEADGLVVALEDGQPLRVRYLLRCDAAWGLWEAIIAVGVGDAHRLHILSDGQGRWVLKDGTPLPALDGCVDIDISVTPFTNTLPIRRLALALGETRDIGVAYVDVPYLGIRPERQIYTCLARTRDSARYRFEMPSIGFQAEITVDGEGLVLEYPGLFRRLA